MYLVGCRIQKDLVDAGKLQATLADETLTEASDLKRGLEMVALLEAQLKEMNPNLDSISEYEFCFFFFFLVLNVPKVIFSFMNVHEST